MSTDTKEHNLDIEKETNSTSELTTVKKAPPHTAVQTRATAATTESASKGETVGLSTERTMTHLSPGGRSQKRRRLERRRLI
jgi:hypothetical protein